MFSSMLFHNSNRIVYEFESGARVIQKKTLFTWEVIVIAFAFLISASLLYPSISNPAFGIIIGLPFIFGFSYFLLKRFDTFSFLLIILICNHFRFYESLWNLIFLGSILLFKPSEVFKKNSNNNIFIFLFKALFFINFFGLIMNESASLIDKILGFFTFSSFFVVFLIVINYNFSDYDLKRLFKVMVFIILFQLFVSIFQKLGIVGISLPYLPLALNYYEQLNSNSLSRAAGTFGDFELLSEYAAFLVIFFICLLLYKQIDNIISRKKIAAIIFSLFIIVLLTGTRSSVFLIGFTIVVLLLAHLRILFSIRLWFSIAFIYLGFGYLIEKGDSLGLKLVFDRISEMDTYGNSQQTSDEALNRDVTFQYAYKRWEDREWIVGDGYTNGVSYKRSLFGAQFESVEVADYHNLYFSLPVFFGWTGALIIGVLFASTLILYLKNMLIVKKSSLAFYLSLGLFLTWLMLFINEYKIQFIRYPSHFFLIWFWMAASLNISKKISNEDHYLR